MIFGSTDTNAVSKLAVLNFTATTVMEFMIYGE